ncbi:putative Trna-methyl transferase [Leptomonas seymouri]|uniref:tRNA-5-taurinomethyluridine 2-sulfurtransferase n=1 Tax=Leptomonas seymouri TaxID=5684 RepID=A0A0N1I0V4_LEPSE|nr:putative Trna-methyl transferase [Leptomonas seymouri]|eukprot:KPI88461.1 putative Trna-methyl transferase [Leptomonas seymouri]
MANHVLPSLRIAIGLSGGVDSAVAALLIRRCVRTSADVAALRCFGSARAPPPALKDLQAAVTEEKPLLSMLPDSVRREVCVAACGHRQHHLQVSYAPFFMNNWHDHDTPHGWCVRSLSDYDDAQRVARTLHLIPRTTSLPVLDFAEEYAEQCFQRMLNAYAAGHTLNVDVLCNVKIKFGAAAQKLKVTQDGPQQTLLATGHYARTWGVQRSRGPTLGHAALLLQPCSAGHDLNDQTHFLARVPPSVLAGALFPIGHLFYAKADVRALARHSFSVHADLAHIAKKQTSTGICFVGCPPPSPLSATAGNSGVTAEKASSAARSTPPSCNARFAGFLNEFLRPPLLSSPLPHRTVFRDATTNTERELISGASTFSQLHDDYPTYLPAYAVTLGQRLRLTDAHDGGKGRAQNYYVARKRCLPALSSSETHEVRLLAEVLVVDRWDHPLLFASRVGAVGLRWWLPTDVLRRASCCPDGTRYSFACLCALRHQMLPQPAVIRWERESEVEVLGKGEAAGSLRVRSCIVCFDAPVRAPASGQAVVVYAPLPEVVKLLGLPDTEAQAATPISLSSAMAVIGSGWVAAASDDDV